VGLAIFLLTTVLRVRRLGRGPRAVGRAGSRAGRDESAELRETRKLVKLIEHEVMRGAMGFLSQQDRRVLHRLADEKRRWPCPLCVGCRPFACLDDCPLRSWQFRSRGFVYALSHNSLCRLMAASGRAATTPPWNFLALLQRNLLHRLRWATRAQLRLAIVNWIERTYHRQRRDNADSLRLSLRQINLGAHAA
jgi:hypothetical protein